jgi:hypothetical protein
LGSREEAATMLVTPDDFRKLQERAFAVQGALGATYALAVFDKLVEHIEPHLVITEPGGAAEWYEFIERAKADLNNARSFSGRSTPSMEGVVLTAEKYWKLTGPEVQRKLDFIRSADLRRVAEEDWTRLVAAGQREDAKTTALAAGSVVEAVAVDVLERLPDGDAGRLRDRLNALPPEHRMKLRTASGAPTKWPFAFLLLALGPHGLNVLTERTHVVGHTLRDWRNLVHPNEARAEPPLSPADGRLAAGFAEKVLEDVEAWSARGANLAVPARPDCES